MFLPKGSNLSLMKSLHSAANLQEVEKTEEHAEVHQAHTSAKPRQGEILGANCPRILQQINFKQKNRIVGGELNL